MDYLQSKKGKRKVHSKCQKQKNSCIEDKALQLALGGNLGWAVAYSLMLNASKDASLQSLDFSLGFC
jgi:hypothetical protein